MCARRVRCTVCTFPKGSIQISALPDPLATVVHLKKQTNFVAMVRSAILWCLSHRERLTTKNALGPSVLQPFSSKIRLKSTALSSGRSRDSNSSISNFQTFTFFQELLCLRNDRSVFRTPHLVFPLRNSPAPLQMTSANLGNGVGGLVLLG